MKEYQWDLTQEWQLKRLKQWIASCMKKPISLQKGGIRTVERPTQKA